MSSLVVDSEMVAWSPHPNPKHVGVTLKRLVDEQINPHASFYRVRIVPGGEIVPHVHDRSAETFVMTSGHAVCTMNETTTEFRAGSLGYAPAGVRHGLKNIGEEDVELVAVFTPPV